MSEETKTVPEKTTKVAKKESIVKDVVMSGEEYKDLMRRLDNLETNKENSPVKKHKKVKENTAKIKMLGDKYILGYKLNKHQTAEFIMEKQDNGTKRRKITLLLSDGKSELKEKVVDYLDDLIHNDDIYVCPIIKTELEEVVKTYGEAKVTSVKDYATYDTGGRVDMDVISYKKISIVKLPNGEEVEIDNLFLNM